MIQDIAPWRFDNVFLRAAPADDDLVLDRDAGGLLLCAGPAHLPLVREWRDMDKEGELIFAFRLLPGKERPEQGLAMPEPCQEVRFWLASRAAGATGPTPAGWQRIAPSALRGERAPLPFAAALAQHLTRWYDAHRFCGRCGTALRHAEKERALVCPACALVSYPVIAPCVIVAVTHGDRILLTRYARPGATRLVLVAGFVEIGETAEQAARREVMEETGLEIKDLRYVGSQPWGLSGTLAVGFAATLDGPDTVRLDTSELAEARWVDRRDILPCPDDSSLTMSLIRRFARGEL